MLPIRHRLLRRRLADILSHVEVLETDVSQLLDEHERRPDDARIMHKIVQLRAQLADLDRLLRTYATKRGLQTELPTPELRWRLARTADRRQAHSQSNYSGPERRRGPRRAADRY